MANLSHPVTYSAHVQFSEQESDEKRQIDNNTTPDVLQCFVCDAKVQERHYALATCKTQSSRTRVVEKLGELVGEKYMVIISEDDVICRSCANLMNTLDRLESEIKGVKGTVLHYLERKYRLNEGELLNNNQAVRPSQPPRVTRSGEKDKKKTVSILDEPVAKKKQKKSILMQCDKCRYTTNYNTFMIHHIRQHVNQKINCDRCGVQFMGNNQQNNSHNCKEKQKQTDCSNQGPALGESIESSVENKDVEPLENGDIIQDESVPIVAAQDVSSVPIKQDVMEEMGETPLPNLEAEEENQVENEEDDGEFILEQEGVSDEEKPMILQETSPSEDFVVQKKDLPAKQILTVAEDGSLEMMEVEAWEEKNANLRENES